MRVCRLAALILTLIPSFASGQTATDDGLRAMLRGEYQEAVRILRPLANDRAAPDPVAQFFMAVLYESGRGVERDSVRACGLFAQSARPGNPFMEQALAVADAMRPPLARMTGLCGLSGRAQNQAPTPIAFQPAQPIVAIQALNGTVDGVSALIRGDLQHAAAILQPNAEQWRTRDLTAKFFLATMYESGRGAPLDPLRACALYQETWQDGGLFAPQAVILFRRVALPHDAAWRGECQNLANVGFDHQFEPVTFTLGPAHTVAWDAMGATVSYEGKSTRVQLMLASRGAVFLPLRHSRLVTGVLPPQPHDYIELFVWQPAGEKWNLEWFIFEIIREEIAFVAHETAVIGAARPFDARTSASLGVNPDGHAVFTTREGRRPRSEVIVPESEKREARDRERARTAAAARVDWKATRDPQRPPAMRYADADGCGNVFLYGWSEDQAEIVTFRADDAALRLSRAKSTTLDIARASRSISLNIRVYERAVKPAFCTDINTTYPAGALWRAVAGSVTIDVSPRGVRARAPHLYQTTVRIVNGVFVDAAGRRVRQTGPITLTGLVGALAGGGPWF